MLIKAYLTCIKDSNKPPHMNAPESWGYPICLIGQELFWKFMHDREATLQCINILGRHYYNWGLFAFLIQETSSFIIGPTLVIMMILKSLRLTKMVENQVDLFQLTIMGPIGLDSNFWLPKIWQGRML